MGTIIAAIDNDGQHGLGCGESVSDRVIKAFAQLLADSQGLDLAIAVVQLVGIGSVVEHAEGSVCSHQRAEQRFTGGGRWWS